MSDDDMDRKQFLKLIGAAAAGVLGGAGVISCGSAAEDGAAPEQKTSRRWGMVVDTTKCPADCTACISACHEAHNVPDIGNKKEEVKWVWKEKYETLLPESAGRLSEQRRSLPVLTLCNHCDNPPCVRACPTQATFRRDDGIVQMDFHRCIGCRFCMAACPYGSRSFNFRDPEPHIAKLTPQFPHRTRGVVEKCNFCAERLDRGQQPLCVEKCPQKALVFGDLNDAGSEVRRLIDARAPRQRKPELGTEPSVYYLT